MNQKITPHRKDSTPKNKVSGKKSSTKLSKKLSKKYLSSSSTTSKSSIKTAKIVKPVNLHLTKSSWKQLDHVANTISNSSVLLLLLVDMQQQVQLTLGDSPKARKLSQKCVDIKNKIYNHTNTCNDNISNHCTQAISSKSNPQTSLNNLSKDINTFFQHHADNINDIAELKQEIQQLLPAKKGVYHPTSNENKFIKMKKAHSTPHKINLQPLLLDKHTSAQKRMIVLSACLSVLCPLCIIITAALTCNLIVDLSINAAKNKDLHATTAAINALNTELNTILDTQNTLPPPQSNSPTLKNIPANTFLMATHLNVIVKTINEVVPKTKRAASSSKLTPVEQYVQDALQPYLNTKAPNTEDDHKRFTKNIRKNIDVIRQKVAFHTKQVRKVLNTHETIANNVISSIPK